MADSTSKELPSQAFALSLPKEDLRDVKVVPAHFDHHWLGNLDKDGLNGVSVHTTSQLTFPSFTEIIFYGSQGQHRWTFRESEREYMIGLQQRNFRPESLSATEIPFFPPTPLSYRLSLVEERKPGVPHPVFIDSVLESNNKNAREKQGPNFDPQMLHDLAELVTRIRKAAETQER